MSRPTIPTECVDCERRLRPAKTSADDHPGTVQHHAHGLCMGCHTRRRRERAPRTDYKPQYKRVTEVQHDNNVAGLTHYIQRRRERLARQETAA